MTQTWLVTGASSGFGYGLVKKLLARGDRVGATMRRPDALDDLKAIYGDRLWTAMLDVRNIGDVHATVD